jgi:hypothetical protein
VSEKQMVLPEEYIEDILETIKDYLPYLEEGVDKIEKEIEVQKNPEVSGEVKAIMNVMGYPNIARLEELRNRRERLERIQQYLLK